MENNRSLEALAIVYAKAYHVSGAMLISDRKHYAEDAVRHFVEVAKSLVEDGDD
jgi:hypothetical protein